MRLRAALHLSVTVVVVATFVLSAQADDRLVRWLTELSTTEPASPAGEEALQQAANALQKAERLRERGDHRGANRARLVADAALTLASRRQARAVAAQELQAARARVERLKKLAREERQSAQGGASE